VQDIGETILDVVVAMAATSLCIMGVDLKDHARVETPKAQPVVVRRVPAPQAPARAVAVRRDRDCPESQKV
jgi:hypothetical protein